MKRKPRVGEDFATDIGHTRNLRSSPNLHSKTMRQTHKKFNTPTSVTVRVKGAQIRKIRNQNIQGALVKCCRSQHDEVNHARMIMHPAIVIHQQEIASYLRLFDNPKGETVPLYAMALSIVLHHFKPKVEEDKLIKDFLRMDSCCKMTDKYLLAMTFVYFKRSQFTLAEYTRQNFFIALYLANTMEEDAEEIRYEIFPWALGTGKWMQQFPQFLKQRDEMWVRIEYRAAVSLRCCEEVMAIVPTHFVWKRERPEHHSGAQRQYSVGGEVTIPHGPSASPVPCALCDPVTGLNQDLGFSSPVSPINIQSLPFTLSLSLETTPVRATGSFKKAAKTKSHMQHPMRSCCCYANEPNGSLYNTSMDWIKE